MKYLTTFLEMHNHLVRTQLELFGGYEVKFENFEFLLTFQTLEKAMDWCSSFHTASLNVTWPEEIVRSKWYERRERGTGENKGGTYSFNKGLVRWWE